MFAVGFVAGAPNQIMGISLYSFFSEHFYDAESCQMFVLHQLICCVIFICRLLISLVILIDF